MKIVIPRHVWMYSEVIDADVSPDGRLSWVDVILERLADEYSFSSSPSSEPGVYYSLPGSDHAVVNTGSDEDSEWFIHALDGAALQIQQVTSEAQRSMESKDERAETIHACMSELERHGFATTEDDARVLSSKHRRRFDALTEDELRVIYDTLRNGDVMDCDEIGRELRRRRDEAQAVAAERRRGRWKKITRIVVNKLRTSDHRAAHNRMMADLDAKKLDCIDGMEKAITSARLPPPAPEDYDVILSARSARELQAICKDVRVSVYRERCKQWLRQRDPEGRLASVRVRGRGTVDVYDDLDRAETIEGVERACQNAREVASWEHEFPPAALTLETDALDLPGKRRAPRSRVPVRVSDAEFPSDARLPGFKEYYEARREMDREEYDDALETAYYDNPDKSLFDEMFEANNLDLASGSGSDDSSDDFESAESD